MRKVFALVRIVHKVDPAKLSSLDELDELYAEAAWYEQMRARLLAEELKQFFK